MKRKVKNWGKHLQYLTKNWNPEWINYSYSSLRGKQPCKMSKRFELLKRRCIMSSKHMKRCWTVLVVREIQVKTKTNTTSHPLEWLKWKRLTILSVGDEVDQWKKKKPLMFCLRAYKIVQSLWETVWQFLIELNLHSYLTILLLSIHSREMKT